MNFEDATAIAHAFVREHYPHAQAAIIGGSFANGINTPSSDIDLLLLFEQVEHAWRSTLTEQGQVIELYVHDRTTFDYFCRQVDRPQGRIPLAMMVIEGKNILPANQAHASLLALANEIHAAGPPFLDGEELELRRYEITTLLEDLIDSSNQYEALAVAARLYQSLADLQVRRRDAWSGQGKHLFRRLHKCDPNAAARLDQALRLVATDYNEGKALFSFVVHDALKPVGGPLLAGFALHAPSHWRSVPM
ncbi:nucleotidyltransferase domain-containing protein [Janthinobacterium agaricidamnosum]|uniref:Polymerase nucleotidyl transferase domain-containing protein n=1 Tax=Janthinobacterium agaricidamnosum NBRC 102515 = DSM 9628 TaxID=1349767 RepID=W0V9T2_9BURK|nr:nucleotidyltransferase domain-containing protein [Janthinobacterium agaricidamnosum]CDG84651.1 hypothetical protein GJA_4041 [Janthinobacterium agaricidamnosum NBRC 102515 = DSM 9628]